MPSRPPTRPIAHPPKANSKLLAQEQRRARLAAELRSNLRKRKERARSQPLRDAPKLAQGDEQEHRPDAREAATRSTGEVA